MADKNPEPNAMHAQDVYDSIFEIYARFKIADHLQQHMFRVAGVGKLICDSWKGPQIDKEAIVSVLLIHDLGNIVKFKLEGDSASNLMSEKELPRIEYWRSLKAEFIRKYGKYDKTATEKMARELGIDDKLLTLLERMDAFHLEEMSRNQEWEAQISIYADARVDPTGVVSLHGRLDDLLKRYKQKEAITKNYEFLKNVIERDIFKNVVIKGPEDINNKAIAPFMQRLNAHLEKN